MKISVFLLSVGTGLHIMLLIVNCPPWVKERRDADMGKITVAVIFGGQSSEHEVSRVSATTMISALRQEI